MVRHFHALLLGPSFSRLAFSCRVILMVRHFHVLHFQSTQLHNYIETVIDSLTLRMEGNIFLKPSCLYTHNKLSRLSRSVVIGVSRDVAACRMQLIVAAAESRFC